MRIMSEAIRLAAYDNINTDLIIAGKYTKTLEHQELADHLFEDLGGDIHDRIKGKILVAGRNFGCGSSREQAPIALMAAGCRAVISNSFARIFYRNAVNIGLPVVIAETNSIANGDYLDVDLLTGIILNRNDCKEIPISPMPRIMIDILNSGGLVDYLKKNGGFQFED